MRPDNNFVSDGFQVLAIDQNVSLFVFFMPFNKYSK